MFCKKTALNILTKVSGKHLQWSYFQENFQHFSDFSELLFDRFHRKRVNGLSVTRGMAKFTAEVHPGLFLAVNYCCKALHLKFLRES